MNERENRLGFLIGEIDKTTSILAKIKTYYDKFLVSDFKKLKQSTSAAIIFAEIFTDYYTCLETLFLRISKFFENSLERDSWHKDLLEKMTLQIPNMRASVISQKTHRVLTEFLKFRHFRRYYFEYEYDWDRILYLRKKFDESLPKVKTELKVFLQFLNKLKNVNRS
jgi:hypothetical protein